MGWEQHNLVISSEKQTGMRKFTLSRLAWRASNKTFTCYPSLTSIARDVGVKNKRTVQRYISDLKADGELYVAPGKGKGKPGQETCLYLVTIGLSEDQIATILHNEFELRRDIAEKEAKKIIALRGGGENAISGQLDHLSYSQNGSHETAKTPPGGWSYRHQGDGHIATRGMVISPPVKVKEKDLKNIEKDDPVMDREDPPLGRDEFFSLLFPENPDLNAKWRAMQMVLWEQMRSENPFVLKEYIGTTELIGIYPEGDTPTLCFLAKTQRHKDWLDDRLKTTIEHIAYSVFGEPVGIEFVPENRFIPEVA